MPITLIGWLGIAIGFAAVFMVSGRERGITRVSVALLLAAMQTATGFYFHEWAQTGTTDAALYYFDRYDFYQRGFGLNTQFVIWTVQGLKELFGGTYLDYFLLFQASGTWGVIYLMKAFEDIHGMARAPFDKRLLLLLFLPGLHFWTAFIGKDGFLFLGGAMCGWATIRIRERWLTFAIGVVIMTLFRPHIGILAVAALAGAILLDRETKGFAKLLLAGLALVGVVVVAGTIYDTYRIDIGSAEAVGDFLSRQSQIGARIEGTTAAAGLPLPLAVLSLLFRPFFFDAGGLEGLIASFENLVLVFIFGYFIYRFGWLKKLFTGTLVVRYAVFFAFLVTMILSLTYYNVGLGLRQKMMMMPAILIIFAALIATSKIAAPLRVRRRRGRPVPA